MDLVIHVTERDPLAGTVCSIGSHSRPGEDDRGPGHLFVGWLGLLRVLEDFVEGPEEDHRI